MPSHFFVSLFLILLIYIFSSTLTPGRPIYLSAVIGSMASFIDAWEIYFNTFNQVSNPAKQANLLSSPSFLPLRKSYHRLISRTFNTSQILRRQGRNTTKQIKKDWKEESREVAESNQVFPINLQGCLPPSCPTNRPFNPPELNR